MRTTETGWTRRDAILFTLIEVKTRVRNDWQRNSIYGLRNHIAYAATSVEAQTYHDVEFEVVDLVTAECGFDMSLWECTKTKTGVLRMLTRVQRTVATTAPSATEPS